MSICHFTQRNHPTMACDVGILWSILNIVGGLAIFLRDLDFDSIDFNWLCQLMRLLIGISIIWIAITSKICDRFMMTWFPYWNTSFFFMGCTFIFFCCSPWGIEYVDDTEDEWVQFQIIIEFITFCTGLLYLLLGILEYFGCINCNKPTHLASCCGAGGSSAGGGSSGGGSKKKSSGGKRKKSSGNNGSKKDKSGLKTKKKKGGGTTRPMGSSAVFDK